MNMRILGERRSRVGSTYAQSQGRELHWGPLVWLVTLPPLWESISSQPRLWLHRTLFSVLGGTSHFWDILILDNSPSGLVPTGGGGGEAVMKWSIRTSQMYYPGILARKHDTGDQINNLAQLNEHSHLIIPTPEMACKRSPLSRGHTRGNGCFKRLPQYYFVHRKCILNMTFMFFSSVWSVALGDRIHLMRVQGYIANNFFSDIVTSFLHFQLPTINYSLILNRK